MWNGKIYKYSYKYKTYTMLLGYDYFELKDGKGKIEEYYDNGKLKYEGEYLNGKPNGKGKGYYDNGKLRYEGECLYGIPNGKGKEYYKKKVNCDSYFEYNNIF